MLSGVTDSRNVTKRLNVSSVQNIYFYALQILAFNKNTYHSFVFFFFACMSTSCTHLQQRCLYWPPFSMALIHDRESKEVHFGEQFTLSTLMQYFHDSNGKSQTETRLVCKQCSSKQWSTMTCVVPHRRHLHSALLLNILFLCMVM